MCVRVSEDSFTERCKSAEATAVTLSARVRTLQEFRVKNVTYLALIVLIPTGIDWFARSKIIRKQTFKSEHSVRVAEKMVSSGGVFAHCQVLTGNFFTI